MSCAVLVATGLRVTHPPVGLQALPELHQLAWHPPLIPVFQRVIQLPLQIPCREKKTGEALWDEPHCCKLDATANAVGQSGTKWGGTNLTFSFLANRHRETR